MHPLRRSQSWREIDQSHGRKGMSLGEQHGTGVHCNAQAGHENRCVQWYDYGLISRLNMEGTYAESARLFRE
jgi:hypothetical protein